MAESNEKPWQEEYSLQKLSPSQEAGFEEWARKNQVPVTDDYDMRGPHWNHKDQLVSPEGRVLYDERAQSRARK